MRILLIENDIVSDGWLTTGLNAAGFTLHVGKSIDDAISKDTARNTAAILVEVGKGDGDGSRMTTQLRSAQLQQPILLVSANDDWREKVACIDAGADDYIVKPVQCEEVAARLRATIRRSNGASTDRIGIGTFEIDLKAHCAWQDGRCLDLTRNEYVVLQTLLLSPGKFFSQEQIRTAIGAGTQLVTLNAIEVQMTRLRKKIGNDMIRTTRGLGYRYVGEVAPRTGKPLETCHVVARQAKEAAAKADDDLGQPQSGKRKRNVCPTCGH